MTEATLALEAFLAALAALDDPAIFLAVADAELLRMVAADLDARPAAEVPLRGTTFAVKDNIDVAGMPTTAACPSFASTPDRSASVVERLVAAGALPVAKTNLDQFATGLVGVRSPYGTPRNPFDPALVPGGSSSGSAVAVARGLVDFALGTDTAGSGRVPAAFCSIVGLKPTVGRIPCTGVVPAVRTADVVSVFAATSSLAWRVAGVASGPDGVDGLAREPLAPPVVASRSRLGVVEDGWLRANGADDSAIANYRRAIDALAAAGVESVAVDLAPALEVGALLYGGPFVAERTAAVGDFLASDPDDADPTVAAIVAGGAAYTAVDAHRARYAVADAKPWRDSLFADVDAFVLPTIPRPVRVAELVDDPVGPNSELGRFTTFANLLDLSGLTVPVPLDDGADYDPTASVTFYGPAWAEATLVALDDALRGQAFAAPTDDTIPLVVAGAHLKGQPLEPQLLDLGGVWQETTTTAPTYRIYALPGGPPHKPALIHDPEGSAVEVDVWRLTPAALGRFLTMVPAPLALGKVELADGSIETGFVAEPRSVDGATEITEFGGWRNYLASRLEG